MRKMILGLWFADNKTLTDDGYGNLMPVDICIACDFLQWNCESNSYA